MMNDQVKEYLEKFPNEIADLFNEVRLIVYDSTSSEPPKLCGLSFQATASGILL